MKQYLDKIKAAKTLDQLEELRVALLGKKGVLTEKMKALGKLDPEERKTAGLALNVEKQKITQALDEKKSELSLIEMNAKLAGEKLDLTLPVNQGAKKGTLTPMTHVMMEIAAIFSSMGFEMAEGPDIDDVYHNFDALNIPEHHPARERNASFFLEDSEFMLRTETSTVQIHKMEKTGAPVKIFVPGRVYRVDLDATHVPMFHQCEGLVVGEKITLQHLLGTLKTFIESYFEMDNVPVRMRQHFFPFTEPSFEIDTCYEKKDGKLVIGKGDNWMELLGAGMVHPNVLKNCGIDPEKYQGFAFGMGVERFIMAKYGITDMRKLFEGDVRWLRHYGFPANEVPTRAEGLS
ncbi:MAG: phenylalanine--tRNA ligase subunit alpha [Alphaproteobacteria bacterium]|nr:phenylalanine--tRNA ligase subunit alpha [Alphaproteobacteria bacterium]